VTNRTVLEKLAETAVMAQEELRGISETRAKIDRLLDAIIKDGHLSGRTELYVHEGSVSLVWELQFPPGGKQ